MTGETGPERLRRLDGWRGARSGLIAAIVTICCAMFKHPILDSSKLIQAECRRKRRMK